MKEIKGIDMDMEFTEVCSSWEKRKRRNDITDREASDGREMGGNNNKKGRKQTNKTEETSEERTSQEGTTRGATDAAACESEIKEVSQGRPQAASQRLRLLFPNDIGLSYHQKLLWTVKLSRAYRRFEVLLMNGRNRPYVTVGNQEAENMLTNTGYEGMVLQVPGEKGKYTRPSSLVLQTTAQPG